MTKIEEVALALAAFMPCRGDDGVMCDGNCTCKDMAVAAISAMREPSYSPMLEAARVVHHQGEKDIMVHTRVDRCRDIWQAMIDAALAEHKA